MSYYIEMEGAFVIACWSSASRAIHEPRLDSHLSMTADRMAEKRDQLVTIGIAFVGGEIQRKINSNLERITHERYQSENRLSVASPW